MFLESLFVSVVLYTGKQFFCLSKIQTRFAMLLKTQTQAAGSCFVIVRNCCIVLLFQNLIVTSRIVSTGNWFVFETVRINRREQAQM